MAMVATGACGASCPDSKTNTASQANNSQQQIADPPTYAEWCRIAYVEPICAQPPCDLGAAMTVQECVDALMPLCNDPLVASGRMVFNSTGSGACAEQYQVYYRAYQDLLCQVPGARANYYRLFYGDSVDPLTCQNGKPAGPTALNTSLFSACDGTITGTVDQGAACEIGSVCASNNCETSEAGTCGTCGSPAPGDEDPVAEGGSCVDHADGGWRVLPCADGLVCEQDGSETCVGLAGAGEECGLGFKHCAGSCGFSCSAQDNERGTCVPRPGAGEACGAGPTSYVYCQPGLTCVMPVNADGTGWDEGHCQPHAAAGEGCSVSASIYDGTPAYLAAAYGYQPSGGLSAGGTLPACAPGLDCLAPGDGDEGTCGTATSCNGAFGCADNTKVCRPDAQGEPKCLAPGTVGEPCGGDSTTCQAGLRCVSQMPGEGVCAMRVADGEACNEQQDDCKYLSSCYEGRCTPFAQLTSNYPVCE